MNTKTLQLTTGAERPRLPTTISTVEMRGVSYHGPNRAESNAGRLSADQGT